MPQVEHPSVRRPWLFRPGVSGNPKGRPRKSPRPLISVQNDGAFAFSVPVLERLPPSDLTRLARLLAKLAAAASSHTGA